MMQDLRGQGPPGDIGTFLLPNGVFVFQHAYSGVTYVGAVRSGHQGWILVGHDILANSALVIQAALNVGGRVYVEKHTYPLSATLVMLDHGELICESGTIFQMAAAVDGIHVIGAAGSANFIHHIGLSGFTLRGLDYQNIGITVQFAWNVHISEVKVTIFQDAIKLIDIEFLQVDNSYLDEFARYGLWMRCETYNGANLLFNGLHSSTMQNNAKCIFIENGTDWLVWQNIVFNALKLWSSGAGCYHMHITGAGANRPAVQAFMVNGGMFERATNTAPSVLIDAQNNGRITFNNVAWYGNNQLSTALRVDDASYMTVVEANQCEFDHLTTAFDANRGYIIVRQPKFSTVTTRYTGSATGIRSYGLQRKMRWDDLAPPTSSTVTMTIARVYLVPITITRLTRVDKIGFCIVGVSGNFIVGIYNDNGNAPDGGDLVVQSASLAGAGLNRKSENDVANVYLEVGSYWLAIESDAAATLSRGYGDLYSGGTLTGHYYDLGGGYGALTDPCPATSVGTCPALYILRT